MLVQQGLVLLVPSTEVLQELMCKLHYLLHPGVFSLGLHDKEEGVKKNPKVHLEVSTG